MSLTESRMMTGIEMQGLDEKWTEVGKVHVMFCKRIMGATTATANGACVKEMDRKKERKRY
jgi:hypothetical protein